MSDLFAIRASSDEHQQSITYILKQTDRNDYYKNREDNKDNPYKSTYVNVQIPIQKCRTNLTEVG